MAAESSIQTNSVPWQIRQAGKNLSEWIQLQLMQDSEPQSPPPNWELPPWVGQIFFSLVIIVGIALFAWIIVQLIDRYLAYRRDRSQPLPQMPAVVPPTYQSAAELLKQARQFEREGNWRAACRALYLAALQRLHDREWVLHLPSRTDGEYLQAIQTLQQPRPLQLLIRTHERSLFGGDRLSADNVQRCRQAYEEIEKR